MNCNIYVYGDFEKGYTQYPDNYTHNIIHNAINQPNSTTGSLVAIHRSEDIIYLIYDFKYQDRKSFGFCLELNKYCPANISYIFDFFDSIIVDILNKGKILQYTTSGKITPGLNHMYEESTIIDNYTQFILLHFDETKAKFRKLPPINRGIDSDIAISYSLEDSSWSLETAFAGYKTIIFLKEHDNSGINSYKSVLSRLNEENQNLKKENTKLQESNQKILRQKKQFKNVIFLILLVIACGVGIFLLYDNLINTQGQLDDANTTIQKKNTTIRSLNSSMDSLQNEFNKEYYKRISVEEDLSNICTSNPIIVTDCSVSSSSFSFDFYANKDDEISVTLKAINERTSDIISNNHTISFAKGTGYKTLSFSHVLSESDYYNVVLVYDGRIIAGTRW